MNTAFLDRPARGPFPSGYDLRLIALALFMLGFGLVMMTSSSIAIAESDFRRPLYYFWRQFGPAILGLGLAVAAMKLPLRLWYKLRIPILLGSLLLLVLVLVPGIGREVNGSMRWIRLGHFNVQASEVAKPALLIFMASYMVRQGTLLGVNFASFVTPLCVLIVICVLLLLEPDYGSVAVLAATAMGMLFVGGVPLLRFVAWTLASLALMFTLAVISPYRMQRLTVFLDPWQDPFNHGFQLTQALIAFGRGGWFGEGLGGGLQKLFYLPEAHTDFMFAVLAEELGFIGSAFAILLFCALVYRALNIGRAASCKGQHFGAYLAYGVGLLIGIQTCISMGVNMGILPPKGLTLPLMSYGANSLMVTCFLLGILLRVDYETRRSGGLPAYGFLR